MEIVPTTHTSFALETAFIGMTHVILSKIYTLTVVQGKPANTASVQQTHKIIQHLQAITQLMQEQPAMEARFTGMILWELSVA